MAKDVITNNGTYGFILNQDWKNVYSMGNNYNMETVLGINNDAKGWWDHDSQLSSCCRSKVSAMVAGVTPGAKLLSGRDIQRDLARMLFMLLKLHSRRLSLRKSAIRKLKRIRSARPFTGGNLTTNGKPVVDAYHPMFTIFTVNADEKGNMLKQPYDYMGINYKGMVNDRRHNLIRYSEVLLWYAESAARAGLSDLTEAKKMLEAGFRSRAVTDV